MLGSKKTESNDKNKGNTYNIKTIPDIFYGGADPEIYHEKSPVAEKKLKKKSEPASLEKKVPTENIKEKQIQKKQTPTPQTTKIPKPGPGKKSNLKLVLLFAVIIIIGIVAIVLYYLYSSGFIGGQSETETETTPAETVEETTEEETEAEEEEEEEVIEATSTQSVAEEVPTTTPSLEVQALSFPQSTYTDSSDSDEDSLSDMEEEVFNTEISVWDTDEDGYYDGQEVFNLYSPIGFAPTKLIDSGLVREYVNPRWQYRLYYPSVWQVGVVDNEYEQVLFSAFTGDYVEVRVIQKLATENFRAWFGRNAEGQNFSDLIEFENRFQEDGYRRDDDLVAYFETDNYVFVIIYQPGTTATAPYRHIMQMIMQSFRPSDTDIEIPEQVQIIPQPEVTTTTTSTQ
ncbi:MAG: hypothetical protein GF349_00045 [Candidatus Magasanikbacteria bacterium]|nr:hypothetical protein [Candidatus Magasanikbacteria bacterium]